MWLHCKFKRSGSVPKYQISPGAKAPGADVARRGAILVTQLEQNDPHRKPYQPTVGPQFGALVPAKPL